MSYFFCINSEKSYKCRSVRLSESGPSPWGACILTHTYTHTTVKMTWNNFSMHILTCSPLSHPTYHWKYFIVETVLSSRGTHFSKFWFFFVKCANNVQQFTYCTKTFRMFCLSDHCYNRLIWKSFLLDSIWAIHRCPYRSFCRLTLFNNLV